MSVRLELYFFKMPFCLQFDIRFIYIDKYKFPNNTTCWTTFLYDRTDIGPDQMMFCCIVLYGFATHSMVEVKKYKTPKADANIGYLVIFHVLETNKTHRKQAKHNH